MSLLWHILRKDLTRLRLPLAIWAALQLLAQLGPEIVWSLPTLAADETQFLLYVFVAASVLSWLAAAYLATCLIQEDSPARTGAFWRTRPISGIRLLGTKLLALALFATFAVLPSLVAVFFVSPTPLASAAVFFSSQLQTQYLLAFLAIPIAALTRSFRQSLLISIAAFIAIIATTVWIHVTYDPESTDLYEPRLTLAGLLLLLFTAAIVINQYTTGRLARSLRIAGSGAIVIALVLTLWPWRFPLVQPELPLASDEPVEARSISLSYKNALLWDYAEFGPKSKRSKLNLEFSLTGLPPGRFLTREGIYHHWQENAPPSFRRSSHWINAPDARAILGLIPHPAASQSSSDQTSIPEKFAARLRSSHPPAPYRADIVLNLHRAEITELPLQPGHAVSTADGDIRLLQLDLQSARIRILERRTPPQTRTRLITIRDSADQFILYNPRTGEAFRGSHSAISIPRLKHHDFVFGPIESANAIGRTKPLTKDFLRDARLVKISFPIVGTFARTIEVPAFKPRIER